MFRNIWGTLRELLLWPFVSTLTWGPCGFALPIQPHSSPAPTHYGPAHACLLGKLWWNWFYMEADRQHLQWNWCCLIIVQIFKALIRLCSGHEHGHLETWQPISHSSYISLKITAWGASVVDKATQSQKTGRPADFHMDPHAHCVMMKFMPLRPKKTSTDLQMWKIHSKTSSHKNITTYSSLWCLTLMRERKKNDYLEKKGRFDVLQIIMIIIAPWLIIYFAL